MSIAAWVYILECADGSFYVGSYRAKDVSVRVAQHQAGGDYTRRRRPVRPVWAESFQQITDAIAVERQIKGWSRAKPRPSRLATRAPQDEE